MKPTISETEVLAALEHAARQAHADDGGFTFGELIEATGWGVVQARARLRTAVREKKVEVTRRPRKNIIGEWQSIPVYRFLTPIKATKRKAR